MQDFTLEYDAIDDVVTITKSGRVLKLNEGGAFMALIVCNNRECDAEFMHGDVTVDYDHDNDEYNIDGIICDGEYLEDLCLSCADDVD